jgi:hypothetical protein
MNYIKVLGNYQKISKIIIIIINKEEEEEKHRKS